MKLPLCNVGTLLNSALKTAILTALLSLPGCGSGDGLERTIVSGNVNYRGQPLKEGQLRFIPQSGTPGPVTIASVREGQYTAEAQGGVPVGEHRVELLSYDLSALGGKWPAGPGTPQPPQILPAKYNKRSALSATVQASTEPLTLNFDLAP